MPTKKETQKTLKIHHWGRIITLSLIPVILVTFAIFYYINPQLAKTISLRLMTTFKNSRSIFFMILGPLCLISLLWAIFKKPHKWIYFAFFACLTALIAATGRVVDYVTRTDVALNVKDASGSHFGDYGLTMPSEDIHESYYNYDFK